MLQRRRRRKGAAAPSLRAASADAQRLPDLQYASAAPIEARMRFSSSALHAPALFICAPLVAATELDALGFGPRQPGIDALNDHGALKLGENAAHLKHGPARRGGRVDGLLVQYR
jgi:hypothetical protein